MTFSMSQEKGYYPLSVSSKLPLYAPFEHKALRTAYGLPYLTSSLALSAKTIVVFIIVD